MEHNLDDPYYRALFEAIKAIYSKHGPDVPLYGVNVAEWVEAVIPVVKTIVDEEIANAIHPEFGWYWREND